MSKPPISTKTKFRSNETFFFFAKEENFFLFSPEVNETIEETIYACARAINQLLHRFSTQTKVYIKQKEEENKIISHISFTLRV